MPARLSSFSLYIMGFLAKNARKGCETHIYPRNFDHCR